MPSATSTISAANPCAANVPPASDKYVLALSGARMKCGAWAGLSVGDYSPLLDAGQLRLGVCELAQIAPSKAHRRPYREGHAVKFGQTGQGSCRSPALIAVRLWIKDLMPELARRPASLPALLVCIARLHRGFGWSVLVPRWRVALRDPTSLRRDA